MGAVSGCPGRYLSRFLPAGILDFAINEKPPELLTVLLINRAK
jgi:hypothetical protein